MQTDILCYTDVPNTISNALSSNLNLTCGRDSHSVSEEVGLVTGAFSSITPKELTGQLSKRRWVIVPGLLSYGGGCLPENFKFFLLIIGMFFNVVVILFSAIYVVTLHVAFCIRKIIVFY